MKRLRRTYQRKIIKRNKIRRGAIAAGTSAAIFLGTGVTLNKALAKDKPITHQMQVNPDADADLLADAEEAAIGYRPFITDQNSNEIPDGIELAHFCAALINEMPLYVPGTVTAIPEEIHKVVRTQFGTERCDICGQQVNMGGYEIVNPNLGLSYPDPNDPLEGEFLPELALHYMEHGSFDCYGDVHNGRLDIARLLRTLELRYPHDPNEHLLEVNGSDLDGDLLTDEEELAAGYNLYDLDQDDDLTTDGIELAKQCAEAVDALPVFDPNGPEIDAIHKVNYLQRGLENCSTCGAAVNMGYWQITNLELGLSVDIPVLALHFMGHGSFSYEGNVHEKSRIDLLALVKILEMPQQCGDLGTIYQSGDMNRDCKVDSDDFAIFTEQWLQNIDSSREQ